MTKSRPAKSSPVHHAHPARQLINPRAINALSNISRWQGYVSRPFSVLDHMTVGAEAFLTLGRQDLAAAFALHDYDEALVIGDVPTVHKKRYCNDAYRTAVRKIHERVSYTYAVNTKSPAVKVMDKLLLAAEFTNITEGIDRDDAIESALELSQEPAMRNFFKQVLLPLVPRARFATRPAAVPTYHDTLLPALKKRSNWAACRRLELAQQRPKFPTNLL